MSLLDVPKQNKQFSLSFTINSFNEPRIHGRSPVVNNYWPFVLSPSSLFALIPLPVKTLLEIIRLLVEHRLFLKKKFGILARAQRHVGVLRLCKRNFDWQFEKLTVFKLILRLIEEKCEFEFSFELIWIQNRILGMFRIWNSHLNFLSN